jgi:hypothetical protein
MHDQLETDVQGRYQELAAPSHVLDLTADEPLQILKFARHCGERIAPDIRDRSARQLGIELAAN